MSIFSKESLDVHEVAIALLKSRPDFHILTLAEVYRNCRVEKGIAPRLIEAFNLALRDLDPPTKVMAKMLIPSTIKKLENFI